MAYKLFRLLDTLDRLERIQKPCGEAIHRIMDFQRKMEQLALLNPGNLYYPRTTYSTAGQPLKPTELTPQITNIQPRPTTLEKQNEIREEYDKARKLLGRFAKESEIVDRVVRESGCSASTVRRAIKIKK